jgi:hypothetical protein
MNNALTEVITPEIRNQIAANAQNFEAAINEVLAEFGVKFVPGMSLSKMVKESPQYPSVKKEQTPFFNRVKSACKAYKLGEALTVEAVINQNFWVRFNGSTIDKETGKIKTIGVTLVDPKIKASKEDDNYVNEQTNKLNAAKNKRTDAALNYFKAKYGVTDDELANAIKVAGAVVE